jgi:hypothetical protein
MLFLKTLVLVIAATVFNAALGGGGIGLAAVGGVWLGISSR